MIDTALATPDLDAVDAVLEWLADRGQDEFSIGEHYAPYATEVNAERIRLAAECLSDAVGEGRGLPPEWPFADAAVMREVWRTLDRQEAAEEARKARAAEAVRAAKARAADDAVAQRRAAARAERERRRADVYRALLSPTSGASESERAQASRHLNPTPPAAPGEE